MGIASDLYNFFLATTWTFSLVWLARLGGCYIGTAVEVHSNKLLSGNVEDTPATKRRLAGAGLSTPH